MVELRIKQSFTDVSELFKSFIHSEADDVDLFGDDDFDLFDDSLSDDVEMACTGPSVEEILRAAENFKDAFAGEEQRLSAASGAIVLHQHLTAYGYKTELSLNDHLAIVRGFCENDTDDSELLSSVEAILSQMVTMKNGLGCKSFTVGPVRTVFMDGLLVIEVRLITV